MIDELLKNDGAYIYAGSATEAKMPKPARELLDDHWDDVALDTEKVLKCLKDAGVLSSTGMKRAP